MKKVQTDLITLKDDLLDFDFVMEKLRVPDRSVKDYKNKSEEDLMKIKNKIKPF